MTSATRVQPPLADRSGRRTAVRAVLGVAIICAVALGAALYMINWSVLNPWHGGFDLKVYRGAVIWWLHHKPLYTFHRNATPYGFTYPPFAALAMLPLALFTQHTALWVNGTLSAVVLVVLTWWLVAPIAARHGWSRWFAVGVAVPLVYLIEPVRETIAYGQVNLYLVALVLVDVALLARGHRFAGVGIGLATAIKLTPGLFILYLVITGRWRAAATALGTFVGATLLAAAVAPGTSKQFWTVTLFQTKRIGKVESADNQSVLSLIARAFGTGTLTSLLWVGAAGLVLVLGMLRARQAWRRGDELVGVTLTGLLSCLVSPISWTHHLIWVVPAILVLVDVAAGTPVAAAGELRTRRLVAGATALAASVVFVFSVVWYFANFDGSMPGHGIAVEIGADAYGLAMLALLALVPIRRLPARAADLGGSPARVAVGTAAPD
jgi:alpha-1,2-mannosyltransferase